MHAGSPHRRSSIRQQIVFQDAVDGDCTSRSRRLEEQLYAIVPNWSMAPVVDAYQAMRGVSFMVAVRFVAEIGDVRRFENPSQLMAFLGFVQSERSTGDNVRPGGADLGRQPARSPGSGRGRLDISVSSSGQREAAKEFGADSETGSRHRLEGPGSPVWSVPEACSDWQNVAFANRQPRRVRPRCRRKDEHSRPTRRLRPTPLIKQFQRINSAATRFPSSGEFELIRSG